MCIIAIKPEGIEVDEDIIEACWYNNPDGAGMMFHVEGGVQIVKGFMEYEELTDYIAANRKFLEDNMIVFHFRISTHGLTNIANTHPFPMSSVGKERAARNLIAPLAFVHNGILLNKGDKVNSDTCELANNLSYMSLKKRMKFLSKLGGPTNKFAVMDKDRTTIIGEFEEEYGWYFSNYSYEIWQPRREWPVDECSMYNNPAWDDDDDVDLMTGTNGTTYPLGEVGVCVECGVGCDKGICDDCWEEYQKVWEED